MMKLEQNHTLRKKIAAKVLAISIPILVVVIAVSSIAFLLMDPIRWTRMIPSGLILVGLLPVWWLYNSSSHFMAANLLVSILSLAILTGMFLNGGIQAPIYLTTLILVTVMAWLYGYRLAILSSTVWILVGGFFVWLDWQGWLPLTEPLSPASFWLQFTLYHALQWGVTVIPFQMLHQSLLDSETARLQAEEARVVAEQTFFMLTDRDLALQQSEDKYRELVENANSIILRLDPEGHITFFNEFAQDFFGYSLQEILGKPVVGTIVPPTESSGRDLATMMEEIIHHANDYQNNENENIKKNGDRVWIAWTNKPVLDNQGNLKEILCIGNDVTASKQAEKAYRIDQERLILALDATNTAIWDWDLITNQTYFSPHWYTILGYKPNEFPPTFETWSNLTHPEDLARTMTIIEQAVNQGVGYEAEFRMKRADGNWCWIHARGKITARDETNRPIRMSGINTDITQRKLLEQNLQESAARARRQRTAITELFLDHEITEGDLQHAYQKITRLVAETIDVERVSIWMLTKDNSQLECGILYEKTKKEFSSGFILNTKDFPLYFKALYAESRIDADNVQNDPRTSELRVNYLKPLAISSMLDTGIQLMGKLVGVICLEHIGPKRSWQTDEEAFVSTIAALISQILTVRDRKKTEEALRESEERYTLVIDASEEGIWDWNVQTGDVYYSPQWKKQIGYEDHELKNDFSTWVEHLHPDDVERCQNAVNDYLAHPTEHFILEFRFRHKDGSYRWIHNKASSIRTAEGKVIRMFGAHTDITARKQAEEEQEKLQAQLIQSQKMESVGRLAGGIAHDFNNMLHVIIGHTELARSKASPDSPLIPHLDEVSRAAQRSSNLTRQLLAFARKQTISPKVLDLNETVESMLKMLQRLIGEDIDLVWKPTLDLWPVKIDPSQIDQILANLCVNARDAITGVGKITIETDKISFDGEYCQNHTGFIPGDFVLLAVSDNGCGMSREVQDKLFEPFFTTKNLGEGTGLGLATIDGIVKQNNGFINVYSEINQGTTFKIYLPRHGGDVVHPQPEVYATSLPHGNETILLVEDEETILMLGKIMLERLGYQVLSANSPTEAIQIATNYHGTIHLLMTDVVMPDMNGKDLAITLGKTYPRLKTLYMSGYTANVIAHHGVLDDGIQFIQKPFSMENLAFRVRDALRAESSI